MTESSQISLEGFQRKALRGMAHDVEPTVHIGKSGVTRQVVEQIKLELDRHELIKIKFVDAKEKDEKAEACEKIVSRTSAHHVGTIGHVGIFYRQHSDPKKRKIRLPRKIR